MASDDERRVQQQLQQELQVAYMQEFYSVRSFYSDDISIVVVFSLCNTESKQTSLFVSVLSLFFLSFYGFFIVEAAP